MKLEHTYLETMVTGFAEIEDKVFFAFSHAPNLGFSMGKPLMSRIVRVMVKGTYPLYL